jgi:hypothetical protein
MVIVLTPQEVVNHAEGFTGCVWIVAIVRTFVRFKMGPAEAALGGLGTLASIGTSAPSERAWWFQF